MLDLINLSVQTETLIRDFSHAKIMTNILVEVYYSPLYVLSLFIDILY